MAVYIPRLKSCPSKMGWSILLGFTLGSLQLSAAESDPKTAKGWSYNRDAAFLYEAGETRLQLWGFAERLFGKDDYAAWRRFRQGAELDLPAFSDSLRPAFVYEIDAANNNFFESGRASKVLENAFIAIQDKDDPGRLRLLFGENTHVLSREDNLSSGNLPTINRSLVLEEHGSIHSFGAQYGLQGQMVLTQQLYLALGIQDGRGTFNSDGPQYDVGNSMSGKIYWTAFADDQSQSKLVIGLGADVTRNVLDNSFTFSTSQRGTALAAVPVAGDRSTFETDLSYKSTVLRHPLLAEAELLHSSFSEHRGRVVGGYGQLQVGIFEAGTIGDLDPFIRFDFVNGGSSVVAKEIQQTCIRAGLNYNLPSFGQLASLHLEYAANEISGDKTFLTSERRTIEEFTVMLRTSLVRYSRY